MLFFRKEKERKRSIVKQVTAWYSLFILLILVAVLAGSLYLFVTISESNSQHRLEEAASQVRQYLLDNSSPIPYGDDDDDDFEPVDDGIYFSVYNLSNQVTRSSFPIGFDQTLARKDNHIQEVTLNGRTYQFLDLPLSQSQGWLRAIRVKQNMDHEVLELILGFAVGLPVVMLVVTCGGYWILKRAFQPVQAMTDTAKTITDNKDYSKRVEIQDKGNELTELAQVLNAMLTSIETAFEREKQFSNDISHELRTPITVILSESEFGESYADKMEEAKDSFAVIHRQSLLMKKTVEQLLELARAENQQSLALVPLNLSDLIQQELADQERLLTEKGIKLELSIQSDLHVFGQVLLLKRLLDNLLTNAIKFTKDEIRVSLKKEDRQILLLIADNGRGIPKDQEEKIWQRFYQVDTARNKASDTGVGLGLSLVKQIAELHGASVSLQSIEGQGATFIVAFPEI